MKARKIYSTITVTNQAPKSLTVSAEVLGKVLDGKIIHVVSVAENGIEIVECNNTELLAIPGDLWIKEFFQRIPGVYRLIHLCYAVAAYQLYEKRKLYVRFGDTLKYTTTFPFVDGNGEMLVLKQESFPLEFEDGRISKNISIFSVVARFKDSLKKVWISPELLQKGKRNENTKGLERMLRELATDGLLEKLEVKGKDGKVHRFNPTEILYAQLLRDGMTAKEIAGKVGKRQTAINWHLNKFLNKGKLMFQNSFVNANALATFLNDNHLLPLTSSPKS